MELELLESIILEVVCAPSLDFTFLMFLCLRHSEGYATKNVSFSKFRDPVTRLLVSDKDKIAKFHSAVCSFNNEAAHEVRVKTCSFFLVSILTVCMSLYVTVILLHL